MTEPTHSATEALAARPARYDGPINIGMVFTAPGNDGKPFRRVRVLAEHPDGGLILEDLKSRLRPGAPYGCGGPFRCPEINLRIVFRPEDTE